MIQFQKLATGCKAYFGASALMLMLALSGCGGGGGGSAGVVEPAQVAAVPVPLAPNMLPVVVDAGPTGRSANVLFTTVTVCMPGNAAACQVIDHVIVDTGSSGLRLLADVVTLPLPQSIVNSNQPLLNCIQFLDNSYLWGPVVKADLTLAGEKASNLSVQLAGDKNFASVPTACSNNGTAKNTIASLGAKGILGIGNRVMDCGLYCSQVAQNGFYYSLAGGVAVDTAVNTALQIKQPVGLFAANNNGSIISLPAVPDPGVPSVNGLLTFGIGTQPNNSLNAPKVLALDADGYFTTVFAGQTLKNSFIDSGTNGLFFGVSNYPVCTGQWYCPASTTALKATNMGTTGVASTVDFAVSNAASLLANTGNSAFSTLAAPVGNTSSFDYGMPFFYGRNIATAIEGRSTPYGIGPYAAY